MTGTSDGPLLLADGIANRFEDAMAAGAMVGGWILYGPSGIGKGALAARLAASVLSKARTLDTYDPQTARLIDQEAHPDYFMLEPGVNEKTGKKRAEILVDAVREMTNRLRRTSATGRRVAVIDPADRLNVSAANALLKVLEEPPEGTLMLLLTAAPGRLLPTITSRCRKVALPPVGTPAISDWLIQSHSVAPDTAAVMAETSGGRPGRALELATGEGQLARELADAFLDAAIARADPVRVAQRFAAKDAEDAHDEAYRLLFDRLAADIIGKARGQGTEDRLTHAPPGTLLPVCDELAALTGRARALNSDKTHTALTAILALKRAIQDTHAGR